MPSYIVEDGSGVEHRTEELQVTGSALHHIVDGGVLGRLRRWADQAEGMRLFIDEGPSLGTRSIEVEVGPPVLVDTPALLVEGVLATSADIGQELSVTSGNWQNEPSAYSYQWQSDTAAELGSGDTYTVLTTDAGTSIACTVSATNATGSTQAPPSNTVAIPAAQRSARSDERRVPRR